MATLDVFSGFFPAYQGWKSKQPSWGQTTLEVAEGVGIAAGATINRENNYE